MEFINKWDMKYLYILCSDYLNKQTEENALIFLEKVKDYIDAYCKD